MNMLVIYDIADPRRLNRIAKVMKDYGLRVQRSVFEVDVSPPVFGEMRRRTERVIDPFEDGVKYFPACGKCSGVWFSIGQGGVVCDEGDWLIV
jgi:CRISPR-associated protein Cas2